MNIKTFIEKAIEGGWKKEMPIKCIDHLSKDEKKVYFELVGYFHAYGIPVAEILLDPLAWQAVGKVEGWDKDTPHDVLNIYDGSISGQWTFEDEVKRHMHRFIDALCDGKTLEGALDEATS